MCRRVRLLHHSIYERDGVDLGAVQPDVRAFRGAYGAWPASGEIDFAEFYSLYWDRAVPYIHYLEAMPDPNVTNTSCLVNDITDFHTYTVEWTSKAISIFYDGRTCLVDRWKPKAPLRSPQPFDQPFIVALTQALGIGENAFDPSVTPLPATTSIDYVRVWR